MTFFPGQIVLVDWRDALPKEPNKLRPAVVVQDDTLFDEAYPDLILVPLTTASTFVMEELAVEILPTAENGCPKRCWAMAHQVSTTAKLRVRPTMSRITDAQLSGIRRLITLSVGIRA